MFEIFIISFWYLGYCVDFNIFVYRVVLLGTSEIYKGFFITSGSEPYNSVYISRSPMRQRDFYKGFFIRSGEL